MRRASEPDSMQARAADSLASHDGGLGSGQSIHRSKRRLHIAVAAAPLHANVRVFPGHAVLVRVSHAAGVCAALRDFHTIPSSTSDGGGCAWYQ